LIRARQQGNVDMESQTISLEPELIVRESSINPALKIGEL